MKARFLRCSSCTALVICCFAAVGGLGRADDQAASNAKIKELQKQRLQAATVARDDLFNQFRADDLLTEVNTNGFAHLLLDSNKLVLQARLDLCDTKEDRLRATEQSIKEFEPTVAIYQRHFQTGIVGSTAPYRMAQALLLEMQIAQEKAKLEDRKR
jgi:hypothetical protein